MPMTMDGGAAPAVHAAPPVPCSVPKAAGSRFGSGGREVVPGFAACGPVAAAQGLGLIGLPPTDRNEVATAPHVGAAWPVSSYPSEQMALDEPTFELGTHVP